MRLRAAASLLGPLLAVAPAAAAELHLNLPQTFGPIRDIMSGGGTASIVVIGDSLSFRTGSYLPYFREHMQLEFGNAGAGYQGFSTWTGGAFNAQWIWGMVNQNTPPHHSLDGLWAASSAGPYPPTHTSAFFTPWSPIARLHYMRTPGGGSFEVRFPDATTQIISTGAPSPSLGVLPYQASPPAPIRIQPQGDGLITILGQENTTGVPGALIHRAANGGWGVGTFLGRDWTFDAQLAQLDPDLVMIWLGQNDQAYTQPGYQSAVGQLVDRLSAAAPGARLCLIGTYDSGAAAIPHLVEAMRQVAMQRGLGFISMYDAAGSYQFFLQNNYLDDGIHFSPAGGEYVGGLLFDAFMTDGASLGCYANCDRSTVEPILNVDDFTCFVNRFAAGDPWANCDGSTVQPILNVDDFTCFINRFAAGCP